MIRALLAIVLALGPAAPAARPLFRLQDPRIVEASGIAAGHVSRGVVYVENDSGDVNRFFAVNARTGATAAVITVPGAENVDWEDLAVAPDRAGRWSVWLADIGDNDATRSEVRVYRIAEPRVSATSRDRAVRSGRPDVWRLRYPHGSVDAESLAVSPDGVGYVVTKSPLGRSSVYRLPPRPSANRVQVLRRVGSIAFPAFGTPNRFGIPGELAATGAALSADGRLFAVRTYTAAYLWPVTDGNVPSALRRAPIRVVLPRQRQGEGVTFAGDRLLVDSEGRHSPVDAVPLPPIPAPARPSSRPPPPVASGSPSPPRPGGARSWTPFALAGVAVVAAGGVAVVAAAGVALSARGRRLGRRRSRPGD